MRRSNKGQSTLEYSIVIVIMIGVVLATSSYVKRAIQGRWKSSVDGMGEQYHPELTVSNTTTTVQGTTQTSVYTQPGSVAGHPGVWTFREDKSDLTETTVGNVVVGHP